MRMNTNVRRLQQNYACAIEITRHKYLHNPPPPEAFNLNYLSKGIPDEIIYESIVHSTDPLTHLYFSVFAGPLLKRFFFK